MGNDLFPFILGASSIVFFTAIIAWALYLNFKKREQTSKEIMAAIEKGIDVPFPAQEISANHYNRGFLWTFMGAAFFLALWAATGELSIGVWGLIPTAYGIANLLIAWTSDSKGGEG